MEPSSGSTKPRALDLSRRRAVARMCLFTSQPFLPMVSNPWLKDKRSSLKPYRARKDCRPNPYVRLGNRHACPARGLLASRSGAIVSDLEPFPEQGRGITISDFSLSHNSLPNMMIQSKTNNHLACCVLFLSTTLYKSALFLQNKPNFRKSQMNVSNYITREYEEMDTWSSGKNKPNQTQSKPKTNPIPLWPK